MWGLIRELGHLSSPTDGRRFARRVYDITGGNPFYILELLKTMFAQGLLAAKRGLSREDVFGLFNLKFPESSSAAA